jgi:hypothetical protein
MKKVFLIICSAVIMCACASSGDRFDFKFAVPQGSDDALGFQKSGESYEMYSWETESGAWAFALFENGSRITASFKSISTGEDVIVGVEPLMEKILALPQNTRIYWNLKRIKGFKLPSKEAVNKAVADAKKNGIIIEVINWPS